MKSGYFLQAFAGLTPTGELDAETTELMATPRCGVRDIIGHGAVQRRRKKRYKLGLCTV
jgi:matrix metalloproteinase-14 (membrane-inserted)